MSETTKPNVTNANIHEFARRFDENYQFLYDNYDQVAGYSDAVDEYDRLHAASESFRLFAREFCKFRAEGVCSYDPISSDRECAAFMFTLSDMTD